MKHLSLKNVALLTLIVRLCHLGLLYLFDAFFSDYDSSVLLHYGQSTDARPLDGLMVWDSVFFSQISEGGYEYEQFYAFFPLFPLLSSSMGVKYIALSAHAISLVSSVVMTTCFAWLSSHVLNNDLLAARSTILLLLNQACTFHTAAYTESLFGALTMTGLCCLYCTKKRPADKIDLIPFTLACLLFTLASASRSNGVVYAGYLVHYSLVRVVSCFNEGRTGEGLISALFCIICGLISSLLVFCPMILMQIHGQQQFCSHLSNASTSIPPWCNEKPFPRIYAYVQSKYWGVGFLRYWQLKNLPNFFLAAPSILLAFIGCFSYASYSSEHLCFIVKGALLKPPVRIKSGFHSPQVAIHLFPWAFMAACALLVMHVQVATRFLSSCPASYWFMAHLVTEENRARGPKVIERGAWAFNLSYLLIGSLLFVNFYPWT